MANANMDKEFYCIQAHAVDDGQSQGLQVESWGLALSYREGHVLKRVKKNFTFCWVGRVPAIAICEGPG